MGASFGLGLELFESVPSLQGAFFKNLAVGTAGTIVLYSRFAVRQTFAANGMMTPTLSDVRANTSRRVKWQAR